jgi:hypothetical protein
MSTSRLVHTAHAQARLRQRGLREADAQLIVDVGSEIRSGVFMLTEKCADTLISELNTLGSLPDLAHETMPLATLKRRIDALRGCAVVATGLIFITAYHKVTPTLRTDPRRDPRCRRRNQRREAERRKRTFHIHTAQTFTFQPAD